MKVGHGDLILKIYDVQMYLGRFEKIPMGESDLILGMEVKGNVPFESCKVQIPL